MTSTDDIVIVAAENFPFLIFTYKAYLKVGTLCLRVSNMACLISDLFIVYQDSLLFV